MNINNTAVVSLFAPKNISRKLGCYCMTTKSAWPSLLDNRKKTYRDMNRDKSVHVGTSKIVMIKIGKAKE